MTQTTRRDLLKAMLASGAAMAALHPSIARAVAIPARVRKGTIEDVQHIVVLTQENRAFDHYFGTLPGVRGFADRFPIPVADTSIRKRKTVWMQPNRDADSPALLAPFALNTAQNFPHMRHEGTPHTFIDAQAAWDNGRMADWPGVKYNHSLGYFTRGDIPFQFALAESFTICDAYHCAMHAGTNPNRLFIWTGTNDPTGAGNGPSVINAYHNLKTDEYGHGGYDWTTYPERLEAAGIGWQVYQNMKNNFEDNPLVGFKAYRAADKVDGALARRACRTRDLDLLKEDVLADRLPQVSWIVAPDYASEHPGPSSPAQGADYTAKVLDALTANPDVFAKTVLLINFDENDGLFDHVPPPAPPARHAENSKLLLGASNIDTAGEYHEISRDGRFVGNPYGLGPRVPLYVISPWSRGGHVASETFDHTSVIRFIEARFGVKEPNISAWRRAVCGDLTSCFDFAHPNDRAFPRMPDVSATAMRASGIGHRTVPPTPDEVVLPEQDRGLRPRRPTPYADEARLGRIGTSLDLKLVNASATAATVIHVYDRLDLAPPPRRYTLAPGTTHGETLEAHDGAFDLWLLGPAGFHRHFTGNIADLTLTAGIDAAKNGATLVLSNTGDAPLIVKLTDEAYGMPPKALTVPAKDSLSVPLDLRASKDWYDVALATEAGLRLRLAGHIERGIPSYSDPAAFGPARTEWD